MNKLMKKIVIVALALTMVMGTVLSVSAVTGIQVDSKATLTKTLEVPQGVAIPTKTFTFVFTPAGIIDDEGNPATTPNGPTIANVGIAFSTADTSLRTAGTGTQAGFDLVTKTGVTVDLTSLTWSHAGTYVYTVAETAISGDAYRYSGATYKMYVYVENTVPDNPDGNLEVTNVGFVQLTNDAGTTGTNAKADPEFTNRYIVKSKLDISKQVAGRFADTTKDFTFTPTFSRPMDTEVAVAVGTIIGADGNPTGDEVEVTFAANSQAGNVDPATFTLKHGEKIQFEDSSNEGTLPAGTIWTLKETGAEEYTPKVNITNNNDAAFDKTGTISTDMTISKAEDDTAPLQVGETKSVAAWTNTRVDVSITGVLLNNLPFILLIVVAVGGFALYIAGKRRKASN